MCGCVSAPTSNLKPKTPNEHLTYTEITITHDQESITHRRLVQRARCPLLPLGVPELALVPPAASAPADVEPWGVLCMKKGGLTRCKLDRIGFRTLFSSFQATQAPNSKLTCRQGPCHHQHQRPSIPPPLPRPPTPPAAPPTCEGCPTGGGGGSPSRTGRPQPRRGTPVDWGRWGYVCVRVDQIHTLDVRFGQQGLTDLIEAEATA